MVGSAPLAHALRHREVAVAYYAVESGRHEIGVHAGEVDIAPIVV